MKVTIPLFDIFSLGTGFFVGYKKSQGNEVNEELLLILPTALVVSTTPCFMKFGEWLSKKMYKTVESRMLNGDQIDVNVDDHVVPYHNLPLEQRTEHLERLREKRSELEEKFSTNNYLKKTAKGSLRSAIETSIGYGIGYLVGEILS